MTNGGLRRNNSWDNLILKSKQSISIQLSTATLESCFFKANKGSSWRPEIIMAIFFSTNPLAIFLPKFPVAPKIKTLLYSSGLINHPF
jgi:hypothetical protein